MRVETGQWSTNSLYDQRNTHAVKASQPRPPRPPSAFRLPAYPSRRSIIDQWTYSQSLAVDLSRYMPSLQWHRVLLRRQTMATRTVGFIPSPMNQTVDVGVPSRPDQRPCLQAKVPPFSTRIFLLQVIRSAWNIHQERVFFTGPVAAYSDESSPP